VQKSVKKTADHASGQFPWPGVNSISNSYFGKDFAAKK
jgi:hypothetical protein